MLFQVQVLSFNQYFGHGQTENNPNLFKNRRKHNNLHNVMEPIYLCLKLTLIGRYKHLNQ